MDAFNGRSWSVLFAALVAANSVAFDDADGGERVFRVKPKADVACTAAAKSRVGFDKTPPGRHAENKLACPKPPALRIPVDAFEPNELAWLFA